MISDERYVSNQLSCEREITFQFKEPGYPGNNNVVYYPLCRSGNSGT